MIDSNVTRNMLRCIMVNGWCYSNGGGKCPLCCCHCVQKIKVLDFCVPKALFQVANFEGVVLVLYLRKTLIF